MIELRNVAQIERAIERAKAERKNLFVRMTNVKRQYNVTNRKNGKNYVVNFKVSAHGKRYGHCTCPAGEIGIPCKHLAVAASLNMYLAAQGHFKTETQIAN